MKVRINSLFLSLPLIGGLFVSSTNALAEDARSPRNAVGLTTAEQSDNGFSRTNPRLAKAYGLLPLSFEANRGQLDPRVEFLSRGQGYTLFLTRQGEAVLALLKPEAPGRPAQPRTAVAEVRSNFDGPGTRAVLRMKLMGANRSPRVESASKLPGTANYLIGKDPQKWRTNIPTYGRVKYASVYAGVDLLYYGNQRQLEHDFVVSPAGDPSSITMRFEGAGKLALDGAGNLVIGVAGGEVRFDKPVIYQEVDGVRRRIAGGYLLKGTDRVGFQVAAYDDSRALIIDPVLSYSTYLGGNSHEQSRAIAVDSAGSAYVTGYTFSSSFPTANALQSEHGGGVQDAFVSKLSADGSTLVYSTFLGGSGDEIGLGIAVDSSFSAYVTGLSHSANFPTTNAIQTLNAGSSDAFVAKLGPSGSTLVYSTYFGGTAYDTGFGITVDSSGNASISGYTCSLDFPATAGSFQMANASGGCWDAFAAKLNAAGSALVYATYLGGSDYEIVTGAAVDSASNAFVIGYTRSTDFPTTPGAVQPANGGGLLVDTFVTKLNATGTALEYSTYLGGDNEDAGFGIAVDDSSNAYVTGYVCSTNFPTVNAFQETKKGHCDAFVTRLNAAGSALDYSTYLGGNTGSTQGEGIAVDSSHNAYVTGYTFADNFPVTADAFQNSYAGSVFSDAFVTKLTSTGSALAYSSYLGGSREDVAYGVAVDSSSNAYVTGYTCSTDFPTTGVAFQTTNASNGCYEAFVTKIADVIASTPGKTTGTGFIQTGDRSTFGFSVQFSAGKPRPTGNLSYFDRSAGVRIKDLYFDFLTISDGPCGTNTHARFMGSATVNGPSGTPSRQNFDVDVDDCGESGSSTPDKFSIKTTGATAYKAGGPVVGGNVQVQRN